MLLDPLCSFKVDSSSAISVSCIPILFLNSTLILLSSSFCPACFEKLWNFLIYIREDTNKPKKQKHIIPKYEVHAAAEIFWLKKIKATAAAMPATAKIPHMKSKDLPGFFIIFNDKSL
ncbi:hypothetical protein ES703_32462 [subsurface metagenome]